MSFEPSAERRLPKSVVRILLATAAATLVVFCAVQDRVTVAGVGDYVFIQRRAAAGEIPPTTIDAVMVPAVRRSLRLGLLSSAPVAVVGLGVAAVAARRARRE